MWFGLAIRDLSIVKKRTKMFFNRLPGTEYLARKKVLSTVLNRMSRYFPAHFDFVPKEFLLPEEEFEL